MKTSRKKLITNITLVEKILQRQQLELIKYREYFFNKLNDPRLVILATLLPAFLWGWKQGKEKGFWKNIGKLIKMGLSREFFKIINKFTNFK